MKILLDENVPHGLRRLIPGHDVFTVAFMGWQGVSNGALLSRAAESGFDAVITLDAGIQYQQHRPELPVAIVILKAPSSALDDLSPVLPALLRALETLVPRTVTRIG